MRPRNPQPGIRAIALALLLVFLGTLLSAQSATAREKKAAFIDDDWDPIERSYEDDPGYEQWIEEALDIAGIDYHVFENQTLGNPPQLPALEELAAFPLVIWNCAAESELALSFEERELIRAYRELGGKMMILGQGILDSIARELEGNPRNPELLEFLNEQLGVSDFALGQYVEFLLPPDSDYPYLDFLDPAQLGYSALPDPDPTQADFLYPAQSVDALFRGQLVTGGTGFVSTNRYLPAPVHFQSLMPEAIPDASQRADYLQAISAWLGFEGHELIDFMHDTDHFGPIADCPPNHIGWAPEPNALVFEAWGDAGCEAVQGFSLGMAEQPCDWRVGFTHRLSLVNAGSDMLLMSLEDGPANAIRVTATAGQSGADYSLLLQVIFDGSLIHETEVAGLSVGKAYRTHAILRSDIEELELRVMDLHGNTIDGFVLTGLRPPISELRVATVASAGTVDGPTLGLIDDYFLAGCLFADGTATTTIPRPAPRLTAHPNPFNPSTRIRVDLPRADGIRLSIHDLNGRELRVLDRGWREAGRLEFDWNGRDAAGRRLGSGVYLLRLSGSEAEVGTKLLLLK